MKIYLAIAGIGIIFIVSIAPIFKEGMFFVAFFFWIVLCALTNVLGGYFWLRHYLLRALLWSESAIPFRLMRFLNYASERMLLRRVGSGYIFMHRLLLEFFASLTNDDIKRLVAETTPRR